MSEAVSLNTIDNDIKYDIINIISKVKPND